MMQCKKRGKCVLLLGVLSHRTFLYGHLTAYENLQFYGRMFGLKKLTERITEVLQVVDLVAYAHQLVRTYSRGMQQRLALLVPYYIIQNCYFLMSHITVLINML